MWIMSQQEINELKQTNRIRTNTTFGFSLVRMVVIENSTMYAGQDVGEEEPSFTMGNVTQRDCYRHQCARSWEMKGRHTCHTVTMPWFTNL